MDVSRGYVRVVPVVGDRCQFQCTLPAFEKKKDHVKNLRLFLLFLLSLVLNCSGSMLILCRNGYLAKKKGRAEII